MGWGWGAWIGAGKHPHKEKEAREIKRVTFPNIFLLEIGSAPRGPESHLLGVPQDYAAYSVRRGVLPLLRALSF